MADFSKERSIKRLGRDFAGFRQNLSEFSQAHHSGSFQDLSEASPGAAILELVAYVGDVLSFQQDYYYSELRAENARQLDNVVAFAKMRGYRPQGKRAALVEQAFIVELPVASVSGEAIPDDSYAPIIRARSKVQGPNGVIFETLEDLNMSGSTVDSPRFVTGSVFDPSTGIPTKFAVMKTVKAVAGETKTDVFTITTFQRFLEIELENTDVIEVLSVTDSEGNDWTEVDYLAQDTVFDYSVNTSSDSEQVPYILKLVSVPRRFVRDVDVSTGKTKLVFGSGDGVNFDDELVPNLADLALPLTGRRTFSSVALDPQNFIKTRSLGLSPFNTTLTITYRCGGGEQTNVEKGAIASPAGVTMDFASNSLDASKVAAVRGSLETVNTKPSEGGGAAESIGEIKANAAAFFAAQDRLVSREDYIVHAYSLPAKLGKPEKVSVKPSALNQRGVDFHVLALDANGHLTRATSTLKSNIRVWLQRKRLLSDGVNILDANIVNLRCRFGIVCAPKVSRSETIARCISILRDELATSRMQISSPIVISELESLLQQVTGVISVYDLQFTNVTGVDGELEYSDVRFDPLANTSNKILYCPSDSIFEVKYPTRDIIGVAK